MKNEIKEILEITDTADYKRLSVDEIIVIKDYIINLQKENKQTKLLKELYKLRNEVAIKYIEEHKRPEYRNGNDNEYYLELDEDKLKELTNILQGENNDK